MRTARVESKAPALRRTAMQIRAISWLSLGSTLCTAHGSARPSLSIPRFIPLATGMPAEFGSSDAELLSDQLTAVWKETVCAECSSLTLMGKIGMRKDKGRQCSRCPFFRDQTNSITDIASGHDAFERRRQTIYVSAVIVERQRRTNAAFDTETPQYRLRAVMP